MLWLRSFALLILLTLSAAAQVTLSYGGGKVTVTVPPGFRETPSQKPGNRIFLDSKLSTTILFDAPTGRYQDQKDFLQRVRARAGKMKSKGVKLVQARPRHFDGRLWFEAVTVDSRHNVAVVRHTLSTRTGTGALLGLEVSGPEQDGARVARVAEYLMARAKIE